MSTPDHSKWMSVRRASEAVGVSRRTIYYWLDRGKVEYVRTAGKQVRINPSTLWSEPTREWEPTPRRTA